MRRLTYILIVLTLLSGSALAQRTATSTINNFVKVGSTYSYDIWARRTSTGTNTIPVGTSQFYFNYTSSAVGSPTLTNISSRYTGPADSTGDYLPMSVGIVGGKIAVTVFFLGNNLGPSQLSTTTPDGERICTVSLTILNVLQSPNLHWDSLNSAITASNSQPVTNTFTGFDDGPLPIQLSSFAATIMNENQVRLDWTTLTETNNYGFEVQKSQGNQNNYETIPNGFIPGHGTTIEPHSYSYVDNSASVGQWFYRLKQIDLDATVHFTEGIQVDVLTGVTEKPLPKEFALDQNYPNPFNPSTNIEYAVPRESRVQLVVYNVLGQQVATLVDEVKSAGYYTASFNATSFSSGLYFYRMNAGKVSFLKKMLLVK